jgi:hypothetical protein
MDVLGRKAVSGKYITGRISAVLWCVVGVIVAGTTPGLSYAASHQVYPVTSPTPTCFAVVSRHFRFPPLVLPAIWANEGGAPGQIVPDTNGTADYGPMQINSVWLPVLGRLGITGPMLADDGCLNVAVAGGILATERLRAGGNLWRAIGWYHSTTPSLARAYREQLLQRLGAQWGVLDGH